MMIVRASRDMDANTEITFWYRSPNVDGASAKKWDETLESQWGFTCECAICRDTRVTSETTHHKRQKLFQDLKLAFDNAPSAPSRQVTRPIERLLTTLNQTYTQPALLVPRLLVWDPQLALTRLYATHNKYEKTLESAGKVLTSLGFVLSGAVISPSPSSSSSPSARFAVIKWGLLIDPAVIETFLHLQAAFMALGAKEDASSAEGYARTAYKILVGEDETFKARLA